MIKRMKFFLIIVVFLGVTACVKAPKVKLKFDPLMPIPLLIVPDHEPEYDNYD